MSYFLRKLHMNKTLQNHDSLYLNKIKLLQKKVIRERKYYKEQVGLNYDFGIKVFFTEYFILLVL